MLHELLAAGNVDGLKNFVATSEPIDPSNPCRRNKYKHHLLVLQALKDVGATATSAKSHVNRRIVSEHSAGVR